MDPLPGLWPAIFVGTGALIDLGFSPSTNIEGALTGTVLNALIATGIHVASGLLDTPELTAFAMSFAGAAAIEGAKIVIYSRNDER